jgi:hypothetical protein
MRAALRRVHLASDASPVNSHGASLASTSLRIFACNWAAGVLERNENNIVVASWDQAGPGRQVRFRDTGG